MKFTRGEIMLLTKILSEHSCDEDITCSECPFNVEVVVEGHIPPICCKSYIARQRKILMDNGISLD